MSNINAIRFIDCRGLLILSWNFRTKAMTKPDKKDEFLHRQSRTKQSPENKKHFSEVARVSIFHFLFGDFPNRQGKVSPSFAAKIWELRILFLDSQD